MIGVLGKKLKDYPANPHLIIDVTRSQNGCGGCKDYAMNSGVTQQSSWQTSDGSPWWLRDSTYNQPNGNYQANCYLRVTIVDDNDVSFDDDNCATSSKDYLCQPIEGMLLKKCRFACLC